MENQLHEAKEKLTSTTDDDEIRDYKFKIKKFQTEYIPQVTSKLNKLIQEEKELEAKRKSQQEENKRRERLFKDLYIELDDELLLKLSEHFSLKEASNEDKLRILVDIHTEKEIYDGINLIKEELKEEAIKKDLYDKLYNTLTDYEINLLLKNSLYKVQNKIY